MAHGLPRAPHPSHSAHPLYGYTMIALAGWGSPEEAAPPLSGNPDLAHVLGGDGLHGGDPLLLRQPVEESAELVLVPLDGLEDLFSARQASR